MGSRRSGGFSERADLLKLRLQQQSQTSQVTSLQLQLDAQSQRDTDELNVLVRRQPQRVDAEEFGEDWAEDGFPPDDDDPLVYITPNCKLPPCQQYRVQYKLIAIRKQPSLEAKVLGTAHEGEVLDTYGYDPTGKWRKIHFKLRGGWGNTVVAWVMMRHPEIGELIRPVQDVEAEATENALKPVKPDHPVPVGVAELILAYKELEEMMKQAEQDNADCEWPVTSSEGFVYATLEDLEEAAEHGGLQYQVLHKPNVRMRGSASTQGKVVGSLDHGSYFDTFGWDARKKWRKMYCQCPDGRIIVAWVVTSHPELGVLVETAAG